MIIPFSQAFVTTGFVDTVNDANVGSVAALVAGLTPLSNQFLGTIMVVDNWNVKASVLSYGGYYQYVTTKAASTTAPARGTGCIWDTFALLGNTKYVVTPDLAAATQLLGAGVYLGAPTKGNNCYIQILGAGPMKGISSLTNAAIGNMFYWDTTPTNTFDCNTAASATVAKTNLRVGVAYQLPANSTVTTAFIQQGGGFVMNI